MLGCDVEKACDEVGHSALMITALNGDLDALKCLVDAKASARGGARRGGGLLRVCADAGGGYVRV